MYVNGTTIMWDIPIITDRAMLIQYCMMQYWMIKRKIFAYWSM